MFHFMPSAKNVHGTVDMMTDMSSVLLQMITHSVPISVLLAVDMGALLFYNLSGMCVTGKLLGRQSADCQSTLPHSNHKPSLSPRMPTHAYTALQ